MLEPIIVAICITNIGTYEHLGGQLQQQTLKSLAPNVDKNPKATG